MRTGLVRSCHDVSEGGLAVAVAEMAIAGGLGVDDRRLPRPATRHTALFAESTGRLWCEVAPDDVRPRSWPRMLGEPTCVGARHGHADDLTADRSTGVRH